MYKVISVDSISTMKMTSQDSALVVLLEDGTYLYPSGGDYKKVVLLGDGDTTYTVKDTTYLGDGNILANEVPVEKSTRPA